MMRVLITGAAGFIGSNLVYHLIERRPQWEIVTLDLLTYAGNLENLSEAFRKTNVSFVKCDIANEKAVEPLFKQKEFDLVFHLAAESHVDRSIYSAKEFVRTNVLGTQVLLDAFKRFCAAKAAARFVHVSTDEVYGSLGAEGYFYEDTPLDPTSPYAASKAASDLMVLSYFKTHKLNALVTRCTNNYGPYQFPEKFIPLFVTNALEERKLPLYGDGMNVRSWLFVRDHCEALLLSAERGIAGEVYNFGPSAEGEVPNIEVARSIVKILEKSPELIELVADRPAHDKRYAVDARKAHSELGWKAETDFMQGLAFTVDWYIKNRSWWQSIKSGDYQDFYDKNYTNRQAGI